MFDDNDIDWAKIYTLPCLATYNSYMRSFQYKLLNRVLFLNKKIHTFGTKSFPLCFFCSLCDKTPLYIFHECDHIKCVWSDLVQYFQNSLVLPTLTPQTVILDSLIRQRLTPNLKLKIKLLINLFLLMSKLYVYKSRKEQL